MGFLSQAGFVGFKTQAAKGTYMDPGSAGTPGVFIRTKSGALGGNRELLIPDPEIGGNRDVPDAQLGPISFSGEYSAYLRMESLAFMLKSVLGTAAAPTGSAGAGYTHVITPSDTTLPWISVEEQIANAYMNFKYTDCKANTFNMEADANGYLSGTMGMIGLTQAIQSAPTASNLQMVDTSPLLVGTNITIAWNGATLPAKSFKLDVMNNLEDDDFRLGSLFLGDLVEKRREVTLGCTIRPQDAALWKTAMWGGPTATVPLGQSFKDDAVITISSYEDIPGATAGTKYSATFTVPNAVIAPFSLDPSGDDVLEHDLEIRAVRPLPGTAILTASVKNSSATLP